MAKVVHNNKVLLISFKFFLKVNLMEAKEEMKSKTIQAAAIHSEPDGDHQTVLMRRQSQHLQLQQAQK